MKIPHLPPQTYGDLGHLMREPIPGEPNLGLYQTNSKSHDSLHAFIGALATHEGEVLVSAFLHWSPQGKTSLKEATRLFRWAESDEMKELKEGRTLQVLTEAEIERYTEYFNDLVLEYIKQSGKTELPILFSNIPILATPKDWTSAGTTI